MSENPGWKVHQGALQWASHPLPPRPDGWARLQLELGGVCGTDFQIVEGYADFQGFLGHEFVARVVECPEPGWLGRRVVGEINVGCGHCPDCRSGDPRWCPSRKVLGIRELDGVFARSFLLPLANLHVVDDLSPELAVFCEPLAAALEVDNHLPSGCDVLVVGDGRLGSLIALALRNGHPVTVLGRHAAKLAKLSDLGLKAVSQVDGQWPAVVEASGSASGWETALNLCRPQGVVVAKSTIAGRQSLDTRPLVINALRLQGSRCGPFEPALAALRSGAVDPRPLIDAIVELEELPKALQRRDWLKALVRGDRVNPFLSDTADNNVGRR